MFSVESLPDLPHLLIFDRTLLDVEYANENRDSVEMLKGALNYADLIRITVTSHFLRSQLTALGVPAPEMISKTSWQVGEIPNYTEIDKIRLDVNALRGSIPVFATTPQAPCMPLTHYEKINDIEKILFDIYELIKGVVTEFMFSGEINSGEVDFV